MDINSCGGGRDFPSNSHGNGHIGGHGDRKCDQCGSTKHTKPYY